MRSSAALLSVLGDRACVPTWRAMLPLIVASASLMRSRATSLSTTGIAGQRADMGDAVAHLAGADHADILIVTAMI